jgi:hypothetical protein
VPVTEEAAPLPAETPVTEETAPLPPDPQSAVRP